jgi:hypothetical protein
VARAEAAAGQDGTINPTPDVKVHRARTRAAAPPRAAPNRTERQLRAARLRAARLSPGGPRLQVVHGTATTATVDGDGGLGLIVGPKARAQAGPHCDSGVCSMLDEGVQRHQRQHQRQHRRRRAGAQANGIAMAMAEEHGSGWVSVPQPRRPRRHTLRHGTMRPLHPARRCGCGRCACAAADRLIG